MAARVSLHLMLAAACLLMGAAASAQPRDFDFPNRAVRVVVPFPPGGSTDVLARILAHKLADVVGQNVLVENRAGAFGNFGSGLVARADPDGYTLLMSGLHLAVNPALLKDVPFDVLRDFAPVSLVARSPFVLAVHPSLPVSSVGQFIAHARARPGELNYASAERGSSLHVASELFRNLTEIQVVRVFYKGGAPALTALLRGETQFAFFGVLVVAPHVRAGRLRGLGVTSAERSVALPEIPTIAEAGVPAYEFTSWYGILAPAGTPDDRVAGMNGHLRIALHESDVAMRLTKEGLDILVSSPETFERHLRTELARWASVMK
jgi:tripartite-type tricarboxylate transporter receptor subunit TctC